MVVPFRASATIRSSSFPRMTCPVGLCGFDKKSALMPMSCIISSSPSTDRWYFCSGLRVDGIGTSFRKTERIESYAVYSGSLSKKDP